MSMLQLYSIVMYTDMCVCVYKHAQFLHNLIIFHHVPRLRGMRRQLKLTLDSWTYQKLCKPIGKWPWVSVMYFDGNRIAQLIPSHWLGKSCSSFFDGHELGVHSHIFPFFARCTHIPWYPWYSPNLGFFYSPNVGVSKNDGTPIAGWFIKFISWKIPQKNDDNWG